MLHQLNETSTTCTLVVLYAIVLLNFCLLIGQLASNKTELTPDWRTKSNIISVLILALMRFLYCEISHVLGNEMCALWPVLLMCPENMHKTRASSVTLRY